MTDNVAGVAPAALDELRSAGYDPSTFDEALEAAKLYLRAGEEAARLFLTDDAQDLEPV